MIHSVILERSLQVAQSIVDVSHNLKTVGAKAEYRARDKYLQQLVGENGYIMFKPEVTDRIIDTFRSIHLPEYEKLYQKLLELNDQDPSYWDKRDFITFCLDASRRLINHVTVDNLLQNTVPDAVKEHIQYVQSSGSLFVGAAVKKAARQFTSPKLSKLLVKLFGEKSEIVKWYTCKCPKQLTKGVLNDWRIIISTLPHHIAGMSYYSTYNWGGDRWMHGYNGTSCMDPKMNSTGDTIFQLIPSLKDETMAIAYLTHVEDNPEDIWQPRYVARCLLRVAYVYGKPQIIVCRAYSTSNETEHYLIDGLRNKFDNIHVACEILNEYIFDNTETFVYKYSDRIGYDLDSTIVCPDCEGTSLTEEREWCETCDGAGCWEVTGTFLPYIDDDDIIQVRPRSIRFTFPVAYLEEVGLIPDKEEQEGVQETAGCMHTRIDVKDLLDTFTSTPDMHPVRNDDVLAPAIQRITEFLNRLRETRLNGESTIEDTLARE